MSPEIIVRFDMRGPVEPARPDPVHDPGRTAGGRGETGLVQCESGDTAPGLYAVGQAAVGLCSDNYFSGMSLADCVYSGRRAGDHLAATDATPGSRGSGGA